MPMLTSSSKKMSTGWLGSVTAFSSALRFALESFKCLLKRCLFRTCSCIADGESEYGVGSGRSIMIESSASEEFWFFARSVFMIFVKLWRLRILGGANDKLSWFTKLCSGSKSRPVLSKPFTGTFFSPIIGASAVHLIVCEYRFEQYWMIKSWVYLPRAFGVKDTTTFMFCIGASLPFIGWTVMCGTRGISKSRGMFAALFVIRRTTSRLWFTGQCPKESISGKTLIAGSTALPVSFSGMAKFSSSLSILPAYSCLMVWRSGFRLQMNPLPSLKTAGEKVNSSGTRPKAGTCPANGETVRGCCAFSTVSVGLYACGKLVPPAPPAPPGAPSSPPSWTSATDALKAQATGPSLTSSTCTTFERPWY
mmetsp:Transcript_9476/g.16869  ORF Transcript_9476/g.16869 Transcript_9476/m.16869 type:complete len:365 (-) Transcript_9476:807-1901(-)